LVMNLTNASRWSVTKSGLDSAHLLLQATKGLIRIYYEKDQPIQIRNLLFDRSDIEESLTKFYAENGWVDRKEAIKLLGIDHLTLTQWVNSGLLTMHNYYRNCHVFDRNKIEEFLANHVRSKAAAEILGVRKSDVNLLAHGGFLKAVSGPSIDGNSCHIFSREALFQWKNDWLTYKEAAKLLGIKERMLFDFAKRGLIVTLRSGYGAKPSGETRTWYSRQSVLGLQENV